MTNNKETICNAIKNEEVLNIKYDNIWYEVEPHLMGFYISSGNVTLSAYFPETPLKKGKYQYWRFFTVSKIQSILNTRNTFVTRSDYNGENEKISKIICKI